MELYMGIDSYAAKVQSELAIAYATVIEKTKCNIIPHKIRHDRKVRAATTYEKGSYVWLLVSKQRKGIPKKFSNRWRGPFQVEQVIDEANYKIKALTEKKSSIVNKERIRKCFKRKILVQMEAEAKEKAMKKQGKANEDGSEEEKETELDQKEEEIAPVKKRG
jgi:hypothetical protein